MKKPFSVLFLSLSLSTPAFSAPVFSQYVGTSGGKPCTLKVTTEGKKITSIALDGAAQYEGLHDYTPETLEIDFDSAKIPEGFNSTVLQVPIPLTQTTNYSAVLTPKAEDTGDLSLGGQVYMAALRAIFKQILNFKIDGKIGSESLTSVESTSIIIPVNKVSVSCQNLKKI